MVRKIRGIDRELFTLIFEASKDVFPKEFAAVLRAEKDIISEILPLPGTLAGPTSSTLQLHMLPIDRSVVGVVHSHPTPNCHPSDADRRLFSKFGFIHIICGYPYNMRSWAAYNHLGDEIELPVLVVEEKETYYF